MAPNREVAMPDGRTAEARLARLLHVLPAASRPEGALLADLAGALGATEARILEDLEEVTARVYYHPGGWPDDVTILVESDRVRVVSAGGMDRPVRLSPRETLCLALALRGTVASTHLADGDHRQKLLQRAEQYLGQGTWSEEEAPGDLAAPERAPDPQGIRETLIAAAREHRPCAIMYAKAGATNADVRVIHPYASVYAEGQWYTVAWCAVKEDVRVFRMDRIIEAAEGDGGFDVPEDFRAEEYVDGGRVYRADHEASARVWYSPRVARWVRERAHWDRSSLEEDPNGSVWLSHRVADPQWVVGHALEYGTDAEVVEPEEVRELMREVLEGIAG
jgi:proteasome accessory factor C